MMSIKKSLAVALCLAFLPFAASAEITDRAEILTGHVTLIQPTHGDVVVTVDRDLDLNGAIEDAFVFRTDSLIPADLPEIDGSARVIVKPDSILILPEVGSKVLLAIGAPGFKARRLQPQSVVILDQGFQISHVKGSFEVDPYTLAAELLDSAETGFVSGDDEIVAFFQALEEAPCISGGEGAETCELEGTIGGVAGASCSVGCREGYDACCSYNGCHCEN